MSEQPLPEDVARWPTDPFELLNLPQPVGKTDARRAYTRLIRVYKPDHAPEQFRRIREAYDRVQRLIELYEWDNAPPVENAPETRGSASTVDSVPTGDGVAKPATVRWSGAPELPRSLDEQLAAAWQQAIDGRPAAAQTQFHALLQSHPLHADILLRLYWLWKLFPEVRPVGESAWRWLAMGVADARSAGPLGVLLLREFSRDEHRVLSDRCLELLATCRDGSWVYRAAELRWQAASNHERWTLIDQDLQRLAPVWELGDGELWMRMLFCAAQEFLRSPSAYPQSRFLQLADQIEALPEIGPSQRDELFRLDFLREFSAQWTKMAGTDERLTLRATIAAGIGREPWQYGSALLAFLAEMDSVPQRLLSMLDLLQGSSPLVLSQFATMLKEYLWSQDLTDQTWPEELLDSLLTDFLDGLRWPQMTYVAARKRIFEFCRNEVVPPERILQHLQANGDRYISPGSYHPNPSLGSNLADDHALRVACLAQRVLIAAG